MRLQHIIILQNKIDLVKESQASQQYKEILNFIQGTAAAPMLRLRLTGPTFKGPGPTSRPSSPSRRSLVRQLRLTRPRALSPQSRRI